MAIFNLGTIDESTVDQKQEEQTNKEIKKIANGENIAKIDNKNEEKKTIVLDGPLSHIYTQALNMVYSNEAVNMLTHMMMEQEEQEEETKHSKNPYGKDVYVYCCNGDDLSSDELVNVSSKLRIALDKKKYSKVLLSVECHGVVNSRIGLLHDYSASLGIAVSYTKNGSISNIKSALESI
jgi:hypothetical protein